MAEFVGRCAAALAGPLAAEEELLAWANSLAASPDDFSDAYQRSLSEPISTGNASTVSRTGARRKNAGVYYTPTQLVEPLLDETIPIRSLGAGKRDSRPTVCDPACGTGNFLIAAAERLLANSKSDELPDDPKIRQRICRHQIFGVDLDEGALAIARFRLWLWAGRPEGSLEELTPGLQVADALTDPFAGRRFDVVLGNPPFANAIEDRVDAATKARLRRDFPGLGGTADLSYYFLALADRIAKPAGKIGLVLPRTILTGPSAGRLRRDLLTRRPPTFMHAPTNPFLFCDANVFVVLLGFGGSHCTASIGAGTESTRHAIRIDSVNWWAPISKLNNPASAQTNDDSKSPGPTLGEQFEVFASMTTAMAYELREFLYDDDKVVVESAPLRVAANPREICISNPQSAIRNPQFLITTGLIEPGRVEWGNWTCRYLKRRYERPVIRIDERMSKSLRLRLERIARPKILVGGLSNRIEAVLDAVGNLAGAVSTFTIVHADDNLDQLQAVCDWLNGPQATALMHEQLGANAMGGGRITLNKHFLQDLPFEPLPLPLPQAA